MHRPNQGPLEKIPPLREETGVVKPMRNLTHR